MVNDYVWMFLRYGDTWGEGDTPAMPARSRLELAWIDLRWEKTR